MKYLLLGLVKPKVLEIFGQGSECHRRQEPRCSLTCFDMASSTMIDKHLAKVVQYFFLCEEQRPEVHPHLIQNVKRNNSIK